MIMKRLMNIFLTLILTSLFASCVDDITQIEIVGIYDDPPSSLAIYIDAESGVDGRDGRSADEAIKTIERANELVMVGDTLLFKAGQIHAGSLELFDIPATEQFPVVVSSYGDGVATIDGAGEIAAIYILNSSNIVVENLCLTADGTTTGEFESTDTRNRKDRNGILVNATKSGDYGGYTFRDLTFREIYYEDEGFDRAALLESEGYIAGENADSQQLASSAHGIKLVLDNGTYDSSISISGSRYSGVVIERCDFSHISDSGLDVHVRGDNVLENITIQDCLIRYVGRDGVLLYNTQNGLIRRCTVIQPGYFHLNHADYPHWDSRNYSCGDGLWVIDSDNVTVEYCNFIGARGIHDSAGAHIDFGCSNVLYQYNLSMNNTGGFVEILGDNQHSFYRYNVSINDGQGVMESDEDQMKGDLMSPLDRRNDGRTLFFSRHSDLSAGPFNSYVYNNTIYVDSDCNSQIRTTNGSVRGLLITNNIFHVIRYEGCTGTTSFLNNYSNVDYNSTITEPQYSTTTLENNLYLSAASFPDTTGQIVNGDLSGGEFIYQGDSGITYQGGGLASVTLDPLSESATLEDYQALRLDILQRFTPTNENLVKNRGNSIVQLSDDYVSTNFQSMLYNVGTNPIYSFPLLHELNVTTDILGNSFIGNPDMGAIKM